MPAKQPDGDYDLAILHDELIEAGVNDGEPFSLSVDEDGNLLITDPDGQVLDYDGRAVSAVVRKHDVTKRRPDPAQQREDALQQAEDKAAGGDVEGALADVIALLRGG